MPDRQIEAVELHSTPGHDRDCALAMLNQARQRGGIDEIQVTHLLAIGYRAGVQRGWHRDLIGVRTADGRLYAPQDVELMYPNPPSTDPDIWVTTEPIAPPRRRWWQRLRAHRPTP